MSDDLENLPMDEDDEEMSSEQKTVLKKYLGPSRKEHTSKWKDMSKWKIIGLATVAFIILSNPYITDLLSNVPYLGGNSMTLSLLTTVLFCITITCIIMFL